MAKFRLPEGARTKWLTVVLDDQAVLLRFNKKGEAKCADKHVQEIKVLCPNLELVEESE